MFRVYLAGPIRGLTYWQAFAWRKLAREVIESWGYALAYVPTLPGETRVPSYTQLLDARVIGGAGNEALAAEDYAQVVGCQAVFVYLNSNQPPVGTLIEIGWAYALHKPVLLVCSETATWTSHCFLNFCALDVFTDVRSALVKLHEVYLDWETTNVATAA